MSKGVRLAFAVLIVAAAGGMFAQSPANRSTFDAFEVVTIKPTTLDWPAGGRFMRMQTAHQFVARNYTLLVILAAAYNLTPPPTLRGPAWVDSDRYDILAEAPGRVWPGTDEQMSMVRQLLPERLKLTLHREEKE